jgi:hypothetical protein
MDTWVRIVAMGSGNGGIDLLGQSVQKRDESA